MKNEDGTSLQTMSFGYRPPFDGAGRSSARTKEVTMPLFCRDVKPHWGWFHGAASRAETHADDWTRRPHAC